MRGSGWRKVVVTALCVLCVPIASAQAGLFRDVAYGLGYAGFNIEGDRNILSGGVDLSVNRNMIGNPLDFGAWDLTLRGPVSFDVSTGGRHLSQFDAALRIGLTGNAAAGIPGYELNFDAGGQAMEIDGTLVVDAGLSLKEFGFYDFSFGYSSRQDVFRSGRFANDTQEFDSDIGPISLSGNIIADALALITAPIFDRADVTNPFASFSGSGSLSALLLGSADNTLEQLAAGEDPVEQERARLLATTALGHPFGDESARLLAANAQPAAVPALAGAAVPEPTVLLLMLLGLPAVMRRRPRRRIHAQR